MNHQTRKVSSILGFGEASQSVAEVTLISNILTFSISVNYGYLLLQAIFEYWPKTQLCSEGDGRFFSFQLNISVEHDFGVDTEIEVSLTTPPLLVL